ncbi:DUF536 domain-containing protein [Enterococcus sp. 7E2_DIV0204]|uniref:DUF536 domain-containing protein n=1 Tax=Enterococcus sp. 7E2_DIV0204 TaxID=1834188 RepID=UPI0011224E26|nr:winged helix-turn-helix domain-containing protein [Enterococcus sp. 7E2_DIV0204]
MADKTIKELAEELGISKQAIRKHLARLPPTLSVTKTGRVHTLNADVQDFIRNRVTTVTDNQDSNQNNEVTILKDVVISDLKQDKIDLKNQVSELQKLLDQQQQLTLQSNKRIEQLEAQLQIGSETSEEKKASAEEQQPDPDSVQDKKWWHFLKK